MRKFINRILGRGAQPIAIQLCTEHDSIKHPIMAHQACLDCNSQVCYICSSMHSLKQHRIKVAPFTNPPMPVYRSEKSLEKLKEFNHGLLAEVDTTKLKCVCGKHLDQSAAMCAACATATCSQDCHTEWSKQGNCTFHQNFGQYAGQTASLRSILFSNISKLRKAKVPIGTKANKTSSHMVCCYISANPSTVFLQRGYRIYGHPQESLLENMTLQTKNLDFYMHLERACDCDCPACQYRGLHAAGNCAFICKSRRALSVGQLIHDEQYTFECECQCSFCKTSVVNGKHIRMNCAFDCESSFERIQ